MNTTDWRATALHLANVAAELVTVARAVADAPREPGADPDDATELVHVERMVAGMLCTNATAVAEAVAEVRAAANDEQIDALFNPEADA